MEANSEVASVLSKQSLDSLMPVPMKIPATRDFELLTFINKLWNFIDKINETVNYYFMEVLIVELVYVNSALNKFSRRSQSYIWIYTGKSNGENLYKCLGNWENLGSTGPRQDRFGAKRKIVALIPYAEDSVMAARVDLLRVIPLSSDLKDQPAGWSGGECV